MIPGPWKTVLIDQSVDDVLSAVVDLGGNFEFLTVIQPTLDGAHTVTITVGMTETGTFYPVYALDGDSTGDHAQITTGATTTRMLTFSIGGMQFIKVLVGTGVTTDKTFYVRGFDRG